MSGVEVLGAIAASVELARVGKELASALRNFRSRYNIGGSRSLEQRRQSLVYVTEIAAEIASSQNESTVQAAVTSTDSTLKHILNDLLQQSKDVLEAIETLSPITEAGRRRRLKAALSSSSKPEKKIEEGMIRIEELKSSLQLCLSWTDSASLRRIEAVLALRTKEKLPETGSSAAQNIRRDGGWFPPRPTQSKIALADDDFASSVAQKGHFMVPFARNSRIVGRESVLKDLQDKIEGSSVTRLAIVAIGGGGKTSIVVETLYRLRDRNPLLDIFWIAANSASSFERSCREIATGPCEMDPAQSSHKDIGTAVKAWFEEPSRRPWVLVVDNADDENLFDSDEVQISTCNAQASLLKYLPSNSKGTVVITTRSRKVAVRLAGTDLVVLPDMPVEDGVAILRQHISDLTNTRESQEDAETLVKDLSFLPLAITQAACYINANDMSVSEYARLFSESDDAKEAFLGEDFHDESRGVQSTNAVGRTWLISFEKIAKDDPLAADYLSYLCLLSDKGVKVEWLPLAPTPKAGAEALGTLKAYSFVAVSDQTAYMHRLVRLAMRSWLKSELAIAATLRKLVKRIAFIMTSSTSETRQLKPMEISELGSHIVHVLDASELPEPETEAHFFAFNVFLYHGMFSVHTLKSLSALKHGMQWGWRQWRNALAFDGEISYAAFACLDDLAELWHMYRDQVHYYLRCSGELHEQALLGYDAQLVEGLDIETELMSRIRKIENPAASTVSIDVNADRVLLEVLEALRKISVTGIYFKAEESDPPHRNTFSLGEAKSPSHGMIHFESGLAWHRLRAGQVDETVAIARHSLTTLERLTCQYPRTLKYQFQRCKLILSEALIVKRSYCKANELLDELDRDLSEALDQTSNHDCERQHPETFRQERIARMMRVESRTMRGHVQYRLGNLEVAALLFETAANDFDVKLWTTSQTISHQDSLTLHNTACTLAIGLLDLAGSHRLDLVRQLFNWPIYLHIRPEIWDSSMSTGCAVTS